MSTFGHAPLSHLRSRLAPWSARWPAAFALLAIVLGGAATASAQNAPDAGGKPYEWKYMLPIFGHKLAERGTKFPLPFGINLNYAWLQQPIVIDKLELAVNDGDYVNLDKIVKFDKVTAAAHGLNLRVDAWLFPFLNVYALGNYIIQAQTDVRLSEPFPLTAGATQAGGGGGLGTTLAYGAFGFFFTGDFNWTRNKMQKLTAPVDTLLFTPRVGRKVFRKGKYELAMWAGTMFQSIGAKTTGKIRLSEAVGDSGALRDKVQDWYDGLTPPQKALVGSIVDGLESPGDPVIHYRLNKRVQYPWNMVLGAQLEINEHWQLRTEVGFIHRTQVIAGLNYRFGIAK